MAGCIVAHAEIERLVGREPPRVGEVIRLAQCAELRHRQRHRGLGLLGVAQQEIAEGVAAGNVLELEVAAGELVAHLVVHVVRKLAPALNECRPRIHVRLSLNSNVRLLIVYGPSVLSPKPLNPVMPIAGMPQASGGFSEMPGMPSSLTTSRSNASSRPNVLKK